MNTMVQKAGSALLMSPKSTSLILPSIRIPTKIRAGAVAAAGMMLTTGTKIIAARNMTAVTRLVSPVLPPAAIPALDSTTVVTVEVPTIAPAAVDIASDISACFMLMTSPFSSIMPDCLAAPRRVPMESNILTREKLITSMVTVNKVSMKFPPANNPAKSIFIKDTSAKSLNFTPMFISRLEMWVMPRGIPIRVAATMPSRMEPFTFLACSIPMVTRPNSATSAPLIRAMSAPSAFHCEKSTRLTRVAGLAMTMPAFLSPMMVINNPIPGVIAVFTASGMDRMIASLSPMAVMTIKKIPDMNTTTRAWPYV